MFNQIRSWFKSHNKQVAELSCASELMQGDMLRFSNSVALPEEIRDKPFKIKSVASYFYADSLSTQLVIAGDANQLLYLSFEEVDGEDFIQVSKSLKHAEVEALVGWANIKKALKNEMDIQLLNDAIGDAWLSQTYQHRIFAASARYIDADVRQSKASSTQGEPLKYYEFKAANTNKTLEVEVWEGNEIEVGIGLLLPLSDIDDFWRKR